LIATSTPATVKKYTAPKTIAKEPVLTYMELIRKFEGYRIQFSNNCTQVSPTTFVIKSGGQFMIDNREDKNHTFTYDKKNYSVKPYGYAIVTTATAGRLKVSCDGVEKATITVAK
jgi:hypothetical protein